MYFLVCSKIKNKPLHKAKSLIQWFICFQCIFCGERPTGSAILSGLSPRPISHIPWSYQYLYLPSATFLRC